MKHLTLVLCVVLLGCSTPSSPTPVTAVTNGPGRPIADGAFAVAMNSDLRAELTYRSDGRSYFRVIDPSTNRICMEAGAGTATPPIVFTAVPETLGCYIRDLVNNNESYLRLCFLSPDRVEGLFWMHSVIFATQPKCIHGPDPTPPATTIGPRPAGGSFAFVMTRQ